MLVTRRRSQGRCQVIPAGGQPRQRSGIESWFLEPARSPPPPRHALTAPTAPGGSVLLCPPATPGDVSCVGRYIRGLSVSRSSALTPCAAVRHRAGSDPGFLGSGAYQSIQPPMLHPGVSLGSAQLGLRRHQGPGEGLSPGHRTSRRQRLRHGPRLPVHTRTCPVCRRSGGSIQASLQTRSSCESPRSTAPRRNLWTETIPLHGERGGRVFLSD